MTSRRILGAAGEGGLAGLSVGAVAGMLRIAQQGDLVHRTFFLASRRLLPAMLAAAVAGVALAVGIALARFASERASPKWARPALVASWAVAIGAILLRGPLRGVLVPPEILLGRPKLGAAGLAFAVLALSILWILAGRVEPRPVFRRVRALASSCGLIGAAAAAIGVAALPALAAHRAAGRPSVILVSIDTMRADALGALGGSGTPRLDRIAAEGALFEQATSAAPWTLPSHASIFTSMLPFDHGARFTAHPVAPERLLLAELFGDAGYVTAAFTGDAYVDASFGFGQGFDRYEGFHEDADIARGPQPIADAALRFIRAAGKRPFFVFVHSYEPHAPYTETTFADPADRGRLKGAVDFAVVERIHRGELVLDERERRYVSALYRGDVARADRILGGLLDALRADGTLDHAVVVVLSDHGEEFWSHDAVRSPGHGHSLYQELLRVPLLVRAPGRVPAGLRVKTPVSLLDVAPTLLELCGLEAPSEFAGRSLAPAIEGGREPAPVPIWSESVEYGPDRFALRDGRLKAIAVPRPDEVHGDYRPRVRPVEVFDLDADPGETRDLSLSSDPDVRRVIARVSERAARKLRGGPERPAAAPSDDELLRSLKSLGYVK